MDLATLVLPLYKIEVACMRDFGGDFACPTTLLEDARIDAHEVYARQMDRLAFIRNCPINIKRTARSTIIRVAVGIAVIKWRLYPIGALASWIMGIIGQARTNKSECGIREPQREILLRVEGVFIEIARLVLVVCPTNIGGVRERVFLVWLGSVLGRSAVVSHGVIVNSGRVMVFTTSELVEWVIGQTVLVDVNADHHNARFATATLARSRSIERVAFDEEIQLFGGVNYRVVESESDISAPCTQRDKSAVGTSTGFIHYVQQGGIGVPLLVLRHGIDKLTRGRIIFQYARYIWRIGNLLFPYHHLELVSDRVLLINDVQLEKVCTCVLLAEDKITLSGKKYFVLVLCSLFLALAKPPLIAFTLILRMKNKGAHTFNGIGDFYAKIDHGYVGLTTNDRQSTYEQGYHPCAQTICVCLRASSNVIDHLRHSF